MECGMELTKWINVDTLLEVYISFLFTFSRNQVRRKLILEVALVDF